MKAKGNIVIFGLFLAERVTPKRRKEGAKTSKAEPKHQEHKILIDLNSEGLCSLKRNLLSWRLVGIMHNNKTARIT